METKKLLYCNCCGKRILSRMEQDVVTVEQRWGYFLKRMEKYIASASVSHAMTGYGQDFRYRWR